MGIEFEFFEAGCGDSILVSTDEGTHILIDGGVAKTYKKKIARSLDKLYSNLDLVVVTHIDIDHICGIIELINYLDPRVRGIITVPNLVDLDETFYTDHLSPDF